MPKLKRLSFIEQRNGKFIGAFYTVDRRRHDASGITGAFPARENAFDRSALKRLGISYDPDGRRAPGFNRSKYAVRIIEAFYPPAHYPYTVLYRLKDSFGKYF